MPATTAQAMPVNIGIDEKNRKEIVDGLTRLLADTYSLYLKTHNFHWNVTGPMFQSHHKMFEEQYRELFTAVDEIAERIRALGFPVPASSSNFSRMTSIKEETGIPRADDMVRQLVEGHETVDRTARQLLPAVEHAQDQTTMDLLADRMQIHEKTAWMLRSLLG